MTQELKIPNNFTKGKASRLLEPIFQLLHVNTVEEAATILDLLPSVFLLSERRGRISDKIYIALARRGIDIREMVSKDTHPSIKMVLSKILKVEAETNVIAQELGVKEEDIILCDELDYIIDKIFLALAKKGYDVRPFWMEEAK